MIYGIEFLSNSIPFSVNLFVKVFLILGGIGVFTTFFQYETKRLANNKVSPLYLLIISIKSVVSKQSIASNT